MAAIARTALDMWSSRGQDTATLSSGCSSLDSILHGGFRSGLLTEICGEASAGKTQLCLQLLLQSCLSPSLGGLGGTACYISTEGLSSVKRLHDLGGVYQQRYAGVLRKRRRDEMAGAGMAQSFLDNIFIEQIYEVTELVEFMVKASGVVCSAMFNVDSCSRLLW
jgi:RecA/RadA recombinase